jgi:hypothetical protein
MVPRRDGLSVAWSQEADMIRQVAFVGVGLALGASAAVAQVPTMEHRSMSGPRLGITFVTGAQGTQALTDHNLPSPISQFGWHFEQQVVPRGGGPQFVIEEVILAGAVEQGTVVPAGTLLFGIRMPNGFEVGMGPNVTPLGSALAIGAGTSIRYGGVSIPLDFAVVTSPGAVRFSFLIGYALQTSD